MVGQTISHYEILEQLGRGGMGVVYKARDTRLDRFVALKFLPPEFSGDTEANARFMQEAKAASALEHPNICTIHDIGTTADGRLYIVMPFYSGQTLKYRILEGPLSVEKCIDITRQIANGLTRAHAAGFVHRDIKPANIMVTDHGEVTILDFGVAKLEGSDFTKTGTTLGSVSYMSPEQTRGESVDGRSDLWSLGVVLYEMLAGRRPFTGDYDQAVAYAILNEDPRPVSDSDNTLPESVVHMVQRLLEKDANDRFQTALDVMDSLGLAMTGAASPSSHSGQSGLRKWAVFAAALTIVGLLVLISYTLFGGEEVKEQSVDIARLAVLPFSNMRSDPETDYLGYALADQVIGSLTYVQNLTVRPSNSVRKFQHGAYDLDEVAEDLAVDFVLAGNYLQQDDRMRLTVEFIDLANDETLWREPIEVAYQDAFEMQDLVAERLLARLEISFSEDERGRMTANVSKDPLAYDYYLRSLSHPEDADGNRLAVDMLRQSIEIDSAFAPAWDALGRRAQLMAYWDLGGKEVQDQARDSFLRALRINPQLFSALAHLSMLYTDSGKTDLAMETAQRALKINPNSAEGVFAYGYVLRYAGIHEASVEAMTRALEIDPTNATFKSAGYSFVIDGQFDRAAEAFQLGPEDVRLNWEGEIAIRQGELETARTKLSRVIATYPEGVAGLSSTAILSALEGDYGRGLEAAGKWEEADLPDGEGWYYLAGMYCINKEIDRCISLLDKAIDRGYFAYPHMLKCRFLDPARGNNRLDAVLEKARLKHEAFKAKFFVGGPASDSS